MQRLRDPSMAAGIGKQSSKIVPHYPGGAYEVGRRDCRKDFRKQVRELATAVSGRLLTAQLGQEGGHFGLDRWWSWLTAMVRRHPHVFPTVIWHAAGS